MKRLFEKLSRVIDRLEAVYNFLRDLMIIFKIISFAFTNNNKIIHIYHYAAKYSHTQTPMYILHYN